jgi:ABC-2 type transport system permease protein
MEKQYSIAISFWTFYKKEVIRFLKVWGQTLAGPIITTSLFLLVFLVALGGNHKEAEAGYTYAQFLIPGLIMMSIIQNSFANTSSSILIAKINGNIVDLLMAPLTPSLVILGFVLGAITRGLLVCVVTLAYVLLFVDIQIHSIFWALYFSIMASVTLGLLGVIGGIICIKFDQIANFTNIIITPLSFLSGTFYSIDKLPVLIQSIIHFNPFFYMIDGFRYAFIGVSDFNINIEALVIFVINIILFVICFAMWKKGYRIKN